MASWGDIGNVALALLYPQGYNAVQGYLQNQQAKEAQPTMGEANRLERMAKTDPFIGSTEGLQDFADRPEFWLSQDGQPKQQGNDILRDVTKPDMSNPFTAKAVGNFGDTMANTGLVNNILSDPSTQNIAQGMTTFPDHFASNFKQASNLLNGDPESKMLASEQIRIRQEQRKQDLEAAKEGRNAAFQSETTGPLITKYSANPEEATNILGMMRDEYKPTPEFFETTKKNILSELFKPEPSVTTEQLTLKAVRGDKEAQAVLDAMQKRDLEKFRANRAIIQQTPTRNVTINGLSEQENAALARAIDNGLDPYKINSRTAKIYAQQEMRQPGRAWNQLGAQAAFERSQSTMNTKALLNTIDPLLDKLEQSGAVLGNSKMPGYNKAVNFLKEQTGSADIVGFNNLRDDVVAEVERGLLGTGVLSDSKYNRAIKNINSAQSLPQLKAAIDNTRAVIRARLESLAQGPNPRKVNRSNAAPTNKKVVERRRSKDGSVLVKYSDGTIGRE